MWLGRSKIFNIYLGSTTLGIRSGQATTIWYVVNDMDSALASLATSLKQSIHRHAKVYVWLSAGYARSFMLPADSGAKGESEALILAKVSAAGLTGLDADVHIWLDKWQSNEKIAAVAMPSNLYQQLRDLCTQHRATLTSVRPWWSLVLGITQKISEKNATKVCWSLAEPDGLTLGIVKNSRLLEWDSSEVLPHDVGWNQMRQRAIITAGEDVTIWHAQAIVSKAENPSSQLPNLPIGSWFDSVHSVFENSSINVEFVEKSQPTTKMWGLLAVMFILLLITWFGVGWQSHQAALLKKSLDNIKANQVKRDDVVTAAKTASYISIPLYQEEAQHAWELGRFNTQPGLTSIEKVKVDGVTVSDIDIDSDHEQLRLEFDAKEFVDIEQYLDLLNKESHQSHWSLVSVFAKNATSLPIETATFHAITIWCETSTSQKINSKC